MSMHVSISGALFAPTIDDRIDELLETEATTFSCPARFSEPRFKAGDWKAAGVHTA